MITTIFRAMWLLMQLPVERRTKIGGSLLFGLGIFILGFLIWNLDNYFCNHLRDAREWLESNGLEHFGHFTQGHGYWHLMTNYGAFVLFTACIRE
jgi:dihydroceramidase